MYNFPKIDLHCHLDGAVSAETVWKLARERGVELPANSVQGLERFISVTADCRSVNEYLKRFELPLQLMQDKDGIYTVSYELVKRLAAQGLRYAEIRFAPQLHCRAGIAQQDAIDAVVSGVTQACRECESIKIGVLLCMMAVGNADANREENLLTAELAAKNLGSVVRGLDLAGAEGLCPLSDYAFLFRKARADGVPFTCHAGDSQGPDTVRDALDFGARRIGHGHHIIDDPALVGRALADGVTLEICITSNIQCCTQPSYEQHPIKQLYEMGVKTTLNTDNMILSGVTLDSEYDLAIERCGLTVRDIIQMNIYSAEAAFMDEGRRAQLLGELRAALKAQD